MSLFGSVLFFGGWLWLLCNQGLSNFHHEPPVREGQPYSINCTASLSLTDWKILWIMNHGVQIATCGSELGCHSKQDKGFQAKMDKTNLTSVLTIQNVTWRDRGQSFTCYAFEKNNGTGRQILGVWKLSRTYLPPDPPLTCQASLQEGQIIHISCRTNKVYPNISCQPYQIFDGKKTELEIRMHYDMSSYHQGYYSATCSGNIFPYVPGVYKFIVNSTTSAHPNGCSYTNNITITNRTTVRIAHDMSTVRLCQGENNSISIKSEILWWQSPEGPNVSCSIGDETQTNCDLVETNRTVHPFSTYESSCRYLTTLKHEKMPVKCSVRAKNGTQAVSSEANIKLSYSPSKPPRFVYKGSMKTEKTTFYMSTNTNATVECTVEGGPLNLIVTVKCVDVFRSETYILTGQRKAELSFIFHNNTNCICTADHGSNCTNNPAAKLIFVEDKRNIDVSWICLTFHCLWYYLLVIPVGICVLLILFLCWRARHKHSDTSIYSLFKIPKLLKHTSILDNGPTQADRRDYDVTKSEVAPYLVVDIVDQNSDLRKNSNLFDPLKQCQSSKSLQKCHRLPRRKPPPLPITSSIETSEKKINNYFGFDYQNNRIGLTASANSINATEVSYGKIMASEELPPLPPRLRLHTEHNLSETSPLTIRKYQIYQIKVNPTLSSFQQNNDLVNTETYCFNYQDNIQSLPRWPPPPVPCGPRSLGLINTVDGDILNNTNDGLTLDTKDGFSSTLNSHTNKVFCEKLSASTEAEIHEPNNGSRISRLWPPPPFRARRPTCKKRNAHRKNKKLRHAATRTVSPNVETDLESLNNARREGVVNTYVNLKAEPLLTEQNVHNLFVSDDICDSEDDSSSRSDASDVCSSLLTRESFSTCSSTSTTVEVTRDCVSSDTEGSLS